MPPDSKKRVLTTLCQEEPDKVPFFDFLYNSESIWNITGVPAGTPITPEIYMKAQQILGFDLVVVPYSTKEYGTRHLSPDIIIDEWGCKYKTDGYQNWYIDGTIKSREDLKNFSRPDPCAFERTSSLNKILKEYRDKIACSTGVSGPFTQAWTMMGFRQFVKALYVDPLFVRQTIEIVTSFFVELGKIAIDAGVELLWITEDLGDVHGPMLSPRMFREYVFPILKTMVKEFKKKGVFVLFHCDGNVMPVISDIIELKIDALHPIERKSGMQLDELKELYGQKITLIGNVESSVLIPYGRLEEIDAQIRDCFNIAAPGGGYIFASDHSIHPWMSYDRARFLFERARKYRDYPFR
jgi:uroporphyrinogen-III decarboxylase